MARLGAACLEELSLHEVRLLTMPGAARHVAPWSDAELVLNAGSDKLHLPVDIMGEPTFRAIARSQRLVYGYPVAVDAEGGLNPLFCLRVQLETDAEGHMIARPEAASRARLNIGFLRHAGLPEREVVRLLEDKTTSFRSRLRAVCSALGMAAERFDPETLDGPALDTSTTDWWNRPILADVAITPHRRAAWNDLVLLMRPQFAADLAATALAPLCVTAPAVAPAEPPKPPTVLEVHAAGPSQLRAIEDGLVAPLTVVSAPPGTGQMATMVNLIVSAATHGERVLYVSRFAGTAQAMTRHLDLLLGREQHHVIGLGGPRANAERHRRLRKTLYDLAKAEAQDDEAAERKTAREKPTLRSLAELARNRPDHAGAAAALREALERAAEALACARRTGMAIGTDLATPALAKAPLPLTRAGLAEWRTRASGGGGRGLGATLRGLFSRSDERAELVAEINQVLGKLPREAIAMLPGPPRAEDAASLKPVFALLDRILRWRGELDAAQEAQRQLARLGDVRSLELQDLNQASGRTAGARELFRDLVRERLVADPETLEKQIGVFMKALDRSVDTEQQVARTQRLSQAVGVLSRALPIWTTSIDQGLGGLPLSAGLFDLVVVDDAERLELADLMPLLFRARRAILFVPTVFSRPAVPLDAARQPALQRAGRSLQPWMLPQGEPFAERLMHGDPVPVAKHRLSDQFRSHPFIAAFLAQTFYEQNLTIRTSHRSMRDGYDESLLGIHWHHLGGAGRPIGAREVGATERLLSAWHETGFFSGGGRRSVGVVSPIPEVVATLAERLRRSKLPERTLSRIHVGGPDSFVGRQVDLLILLPGIDDDSERKQAALAGDAVLYHDAVAAARVGLHVVGDRDACQEAGGHVERLLGWATLPGEDPVDDDGFFDPVFDEAFGTGGEEGSDALQSLRALLEAAGLPYQANVREGAYLLQVRALSPFGALYNIEINRPLQDLAGEADLIAEQERDAALAALGYRVVRIEEAELAAKADLMVERLRRLA